MRPTILLSVMFTVPVSPRTLSWAPWKLICPREELIEICMTQAFVDFGASETLLKIADAAIAD